MATVTVEVNGRSYPVGCADGQEARVSQLAQEFNNRVSQVADQVGQVGDLKLFLMGALMLADELSEARRGRAAPAAPATAEPAASNDGVAEALNAVASRLEKLAQSF
ncbi:cell division protein ZapA [Brevundimonas sp.]|uniref:cell division protein ZapA n=1 Tax=Brevundimonas sp. TaxID=1871086 RepID=UPI0028A0B4E5|nr:cell division protein ZapA [Brevundimonas sp.]